MTRKHIHTRHVEQQRSTSDYFFTLLKSVLTRNMLRAYASANTLVPRNNPTQP